MFSRPVSWGWNPVPSSSSAEMRPFATIRPVVGRWMLAMSRSRVDLPDPLWPMMPCIDPSWMSKDTPFRAQNSRHWEVSALWMMASFR